MLYISKTCPVLRLISHMVDIWLMELIWLGKTGLSVLPPPYFNLLSLHPSPRLSLVFCLPLIPCRMNGTDVVGQDSTPWSPSPHYSLSMRSETCVLIIVPPHPPASPSSGEKRTQRGGRWGDQKQPSQRGREEEHTAMFKEYEENTLFNYSQITSGVGQVTCWMFAERHSREFRVWWGYGWYSGAAVGVRVLHPGGVDWRCGSVRGSSGCPASPHGQSTRRGARAKTSVQQSQDRTRGPRAGSRSMSVTV